MNERKITGVVVDSGHGGSDPGAISGNLKEKDFNLEAANYMTKRLQELGIPVVSVKTTDENGNIIQEESKTTVVPFKENLISASYGKFCLEGDITLLNNLYKTGIGSRRSEGFGMFEVL